MEHPIIQIKNAITALLKGIDPDTDVFYEEIKGTEEKHGLDEPETYYFVANLRPWQQPWLFR